jgi:sigma54-dependent transcription regulator
LRGSAGYSLESELFGHVRGAFTDARRAHDGLVAQAEDGTLFLDEVEAMTPRAQIVLLRFLQDHKYRPVGGRALANGNVRVIASTNVDLEHLVHRNLFRRDLMFRLGILTLTMPPLRHRGDDVTSLVHHFLRRFVVEYRRSWSFKTPWRDAFHHDPSLRIDFDTSESVSKSSRENVSLAARLCGKDRSSLNKLIKKQGLGNDRASTAPGEISSPSSKNPIQKKRSWSIFL